jgi:3-deoxy-D-manno-octulosonate 8-phosphate phosphatase KdsC-like HAD superfamily phosphatase
MDRKYKNIKLIISAVDGIITEDMCPIDELVNVPYKFFYMKDFEAINELKKYFKFVFLSGDNKVTYHLCKRKQIPFFWANKNGKFKTKLDCMAEIRTKYRVNLDEMLFVGYSYSDIGCAQMAGSCVCGIDASKKIKSIATKTGEVIDSFGGTGLLSYLYDDILYPELIVRQKEST